MAGILVDGEKFHIDGQIVTHDESRAWFQMSTGPDAHVHARSKKNLEKPAELEAQALEAWKIYRRRGEDAA